MLQQYERHQRLSDSEFRFDSRPVRTAASDEEEDEFTGGAAMDDLVDEEDEDDPTWQLHTHDDDDDVTRPAKQRRRASKPSAEKRSSPKAALAAMTVTRNEVELDDTEVDTDEEILRIAKKVWEAAKPMDKALPGTPLTWSSVHVFVPLLFSFFSSSSSPLSLTCFLNLPPISLLFFALSLVST